MPVNNYREYFSRDNVNCPNRISSFLLFMWLGGKLADILCYRLKAEDFVDNVSFFTSPLHTLMRKLDDFELSTSSLIVFCFSFKYLSPVAFITFFIY